MFRDSYEGDDSLYNCHITDLSSTEYKHRFLFLLPYENKQMECGYLTRVSGFFYRILCLMITVLFFACPA